MDADTHKRLREPFPAEVVGKLPRVWCGKCREAIKNRRPSCDEHQRAKCQVCGNNMTAAHLHIDYVGHAAITDRMLSVDPSWTWEPVAFGPDGLPVLDENGGLWIRLTVAGVTRLGYGDAEGKNGPAAVKEAIGDALRNGAMRFGVGLDLWHKDGVLAQHDDEPVPAPQAPANGNARQRPTQPPKSSPAGPSVAYAVAELKAACEANGWNRDIVAVKYAEKAGHGLGDATDPALIESFRKHLFNLPQAELQPAAKEAAA